MSLDFNSEIIGDKLSALLNQPESEVLDFKREFGEKALETLSAFANTRGGTLVLGVTDTARKITGVREPDKVASRIVDILGIHPSVEEVKEGEKSVVLVYVSASPSAVSYRGRFYRRVGARNVELKGAKLQRLLLQKGGMTWDVVPVDAPLDEIDYETVRDFVHMARVRLPGISEEEPVETIFRKLGLLYEGKLTRGAVLLFGRKPQRYFPHATVHIGRFKDHLTILDDVLLSRNLFYQLTETLKVIQKHINVRFEITGEARRREIWDYPLEALRETTINALIHRDYLITGDVQIRVYDDKIYFWNPGRLPEGVTLEELRIMPHSSVLRNPSLAQVFYYAGLIEKWGTGTARIVEMCLEHGLPEPTFENTSGGFQVVFRKDIYTEEYLRSLGLNERQVRAVLYAKVYGKISNEEYQREFGVSRNTASRELRTLVEKGIFSHSGKRGAGSFYYVDKG